MPDFITLLRDIRDRMYVDMQSWYETVQAITVGSTTNIDPIDGVVQPATVTYDPDTNEFDFGIPTSPVVDNTSATLVRTNGTTPMDTGYVPSVTKDVMTKEATESLTNALDQRLIIIEAETSQWVLKTGTVPAETQLIQNTWGDGIFLMHVQPVNANFGTDLYMTVNVKNGILTRTIESNTATGTANLIAQIDFISNTNTNLEIQTREVTINTGAVVLDGTNIIAVWKWEIA